MRINTLDKSVKEKLIVESLTQAAKLVGGRKNLCKLWGWPRGSLDYAFSKATVPPHIAVKLNRLIPAARAELLYPHIYTERMMDHERSAW